MRQPLENLAAMATARRGNHPALWLIFGVVALVNAVTSILDRWAFLPDFRGWTFFNRWSGMRKATFASDPLLFTTWVVTMCIAAVFCIGIGLVALSVRARYRKQRHPLSEVV